MCLDAYNELSRMRVQTIDKRLDTRRRKMCPHEFHGMSSSKGHGEQSPSTFISFPYPMGHSVTHSFNAIYPIKGLIQWFYDSFA